MFVVALDVSKGNSYAVIYEGNVCHWEGAVEHSQTGFGGLMDKIRLLPQLPEIVFEATGIYSRPVETFCQNNALSYVLLNPLQAKKQLEEDSLRSWKTDKQDAHKLAQTHALKKRTPKVEQEGIYQAMRDLTRFYHEVEDDIKRTRMHLHNCLQLVFPELEHFFSSRVNLYALTLTSLFPHPEMVLRSTPTKIKNQLMKATRKNISENRARKKAEELVLLAQNSYPAVDENSIHCQKTIYYAEKIQDLLQQKKAIQDQLVQTATELEEFELYATIPGIGELTSALLIGELGDIRRFATSNKLNAFVGIDIRRYQSGSFMGKDRINKRGNPKGRKILYIAVRNMIRQQKAAPNHIVDFYYKLKKQPVPKKDKVAVVACMNKLLKCMHSMMRNHTKYDYAHTASKDQSLTLI